MTAADVRSPNVVLFDFDGTLIDSAPGILRCLHETFDHFGLDPLSPPELEALIGPPFSTTLPALIGDLDVGEVLRYYRVLYRQGGGMFEAALYPGIAGLVEGLRRTGVRLAVATSKQEDLVEPILSRLGIVHCFDVLCGHDEPTRTSKSAVIGEALRRLGVSDVAYLADVADVADSAEVADRAHVVMVGDRLHDVVGARAHDVATIGAGWGYAQGDELVAAGAVAVMADPDALAWFWGIS